jgi:hypothetical protein
LALSRKRKPLFGGRIGGTGAPGGGLAISEENVVFCEVGDTHRFGLYA